MKIIALTNRSFRTELRRSLEGCRLRLSFGLDLFEQGFCLDLFGFLIPLLFLDRLRYEPHEIMESWGVAYYERSIKLNWGRYCKFIHLPWDYDHIRHDVMRPDGAFVPFVGSWEEGPLRVVSDNGATMGGKEPDGRWTATAPYRYVLKNGEVQQRQATIYVERREWRQKWLKWCPWFAKKATGIEVEFDGEVGERSGSWKGGTIGCGYGMRPGENPLECLQRMEMERRFP